MIASTVVARMPIRIAPFILRTTSTIVRSSPITNTSVGQPRSWVATPSSTGTGRFAVRRTKPASTKPISAMNSPMPTPIAVLSCGGMAWNTAVRKPVSTSAVITRPSSTTRPIASGQLIRLAMPNATNAFSPRPVAIANGYLPITPIAIVSTPATSAVTAATVGMPRNLPSASATVPMISGLSTTM